MALGPIYQQSLYAWLDECVANVMRLLGHYDIVSHVDPFILQMFLWEHFEALTPIPVEYSATVSNRVLRWVSRK